MNRIFKALQPRLWTTGSSVKKDPHSNAARSSPSKHATPDNAEPFGDEDSKHDDETVASPKFRPLINGYEDTTAYPYIHEPPVGRPLPYLPAEIQLQILESSHWEDHPNFAKVCKLWRQFIKTSAVVREHRYEQYNRFYHEQWQLPAYKNRPKPRLHHMVEHLEVFVRGLDGRLRPGKIQLHTQRDRWGGYWTYKVGHTSPRKWKKPRCKVLEPYDYSIFKDDPVIIHEGGDPGVGNVHIKASETSYRIEDKFSVFGTYFKFYDGMTVGQYIDELIRGVNLEKGLPVGIGGPTDNEWNDNNIVWLSVYSSLQFWRQILEMRFVVTAISYDIER
ncbi:hypothetical protein H072_7135 [Dactylellina haptotyla CBS 200.50]|uniref:F-box domain-containing protein n=1 Tax=Dactylellina haptotyla (strain CBS 200.50) TaxID=1284197 RepID=S8A899_DACHA|nr:hypothetical protein H072_7135 [Dactylellina haptotyla CBS 200.50]